MVGGQMVVKIMIMSDVLMDHKNIYSQISLTKSCNFAQGEGKGRHSFYFGINK